MKFSKNVNTQLGRSLAVFGAIGALLLAAVLPSVALAAQITQRSLELSSSSKGATGVSYVLTFTPATNASAFVVDFCDNTPLIGEACNAPADFDVSSATVNTTNGGNFTKSALTAAKNNALVLTGSLTAGTEASLQLDGVTNPSGAGQLYARIVSYSGADAATATSNAKAYTSTAIGATAVDQGSVAASITDSVGVSGAVLESLSFCVSGAAVKANCDVSGNPAPTLRLGKDLGNGVIALDPSEVSQGSIYTQLSTNAVSGAVVRLKSSAANCGGLLRAGDLTACDITPAQNTNITPGQAKFGVKTSTSTYTSGVTNPNGTLEPVSTSPYNDTTFALNYASDQQTGVTSPFGDPFLDTAGHPANNVNMALTFGASVGNDTPAGNYSTDISLVATGKF